MCVVAQLDILRRLISRKHEKSNGSTSPESPLGVTSGELAEMLPIDRSTICYHLNVMEEVELVQRTETKNTGYYRLDFDRLTKLRAHLNP